MNNSRKKEELEQLKAIYKDDWGILSSININTHEEYEESATFDASQWESLQIDMNTKTGSNLPLPDEMLEIKRQNMMRVENVSLPYNIWGSIDTQMLIKNIISGEEMQLVANIGILDNERVLGYLPSKVWYEDTTSVDTFINAIDYFSSKGVTDKLRIGTFRMLFYVNDSLPAELKPFKEKTYVMWFNLKANETLLYDLELRMFMDQIMTEMGMVYFCVFDESNYHKVVI